MSKSQTLKGGNILGDVKDLAVPFGLVLAKSGIDYVMTKKTPKSKTQSTKPKATKPKAKKIVRGGAAGGECALCASSAKGGATEAAHAQLRAEFKNLSMNLKALLNDS